jgi:hypothetical protein
MGQVKLSGTIVGGPVGVSAGFPGAVTTIDLETTPAPKPMQVADSGPRSVNSSGAYVSVGSIGSGMSVEQGTFLYLRTNAPVWVRRTIYQSPGPDLTVEERVHGLLIVEFPPGEYLKLLEVKGSAQVEYFVSGSQLPGVVRLIQFSAHTSPLPTRKNDHV